MDPNANFKELCEQLFHIGGDYHRAIELLEALANWVADSGFEPEEGDYHWGDVFVGAYWFLVELVRPLAPVEYRCLCALGMVYKPGPHSALTADSQEQDTYDALQSLFTEHTTGANDEN